MSDPGLVTALSAVIRGAVEPAAAGPILAAAPASALAQAAAKTNVVGETKNIVSSILSQGNQSNANVAAALRSLPGPPVAAHGGAARPANAIGNAYYAGQRRGYVFGTPNAPTFRRTGQNSKNSSYKGWVLRPVEGPLRNGNVPRFEFVHKTYSGFGGGNFQQTIRQNAPPDVAAGLLAIITGAVKPQEAARVIKATSPANMPNRVANIGRQMAEIVVGAVGSRNAIGALPAAQRQRFTALPAAQQEKILRQPRKFGNFFKFPSWFRGGARPLFPDRPAAGGGQTALGAAQSLHAQTHVGAPQNLEKLKTTLTQGNNRPSLLTRILGIRRKLVPAPSQRQSNQSQRQSNQSQSQRHGPPKKPRSFMARIFGTPNNNTPNNGAPKKKTERSFWNFLQKLWPPAKKLVDATGELEGRTLTKAEIARLMKLIEELRKSIKDPVKRQIVNVIIKKYYFTAVLRGTKPLPAGTGAHLEHAFEHELGHGNYTNTNIKNMFAKRGKANGPSNSDLNERLEQEIAKLEGMNDTARARRMGELLRIVPAGFRGRAKLKTMILEEIRRIGHGNNPEAVRRYLADLKSDLKLGYSNTNLIAAIGIENKRALENIRRNVGIGRRPGESHAEYERRLGNTKRRSYETNENYNRRIRSSRRHSGESNNNYERRMETMSRRRNENPNNYERRSEAQRRRLEMEREEIMQRRRLRGFTGTTPPRPGGNGGNGMNGTPPLPTNQNNAIRRAGGVNAAMGAVAAVPGGAPEIAKAAEILNETGGNVAQAVNIKGASPVAVQAVRRLGGPTNAVNALEGLNTLSQTRATRKRKASRMIARPRKRGPGRRAKPTGPRVAELQRVIKSVKKRKLISLVAHNITKTNNIHENENRLKKYYQKVVKAAIMRTPLANIVKKSKARVRAKK